MTYLLAFVLFVGLIVLMALGVLFRRKSLQGSCGGLANIDIERECNCVDVCDEYQKVLYQIEEPTSHG
ncbi:(Na+)-NQR maturation NqrM [Vibrio aestuarianus]|uniref:(Na+)-NQR maturation NqrM n=1 Tax=Vibrio aestuarianus TaxID=28171 RepID=UPI00237C6ABF|nr:(Na+)-NQR maturation NqrM [Vibrio aestuarianus]MDE1238973.1 (Na+)-NQR maturation NqrM [Vibrio aestuarianus]